MSFVVKSIEFYIQIEGHVDADSEKENLQKELDYALGFLASIEKKLSNERFVNNAPTQVVEMEQKKKSDTEAKIQTLQESLARLN